MYVIVISIQADETRPQTSLYLNILVQDVTKLVEKHLDEFLLKEHYRYSTISRNLND